METTMPLELVPLALECGTQRNGKTPVLVKVTRHIGPGPTSVVPQNRSGGGAGL
jgi:hypothetical protein